MGDWQPGDRVAVLSGAPYGGHRVDVATVERVTATQVVLEGGTRRFRRDDGREVGKQRQGGYGMVAELRPLDDPQVRQLRAEQAVNGLVRRIERARDAHKREPLALLDVIEQETARTRVAVEKLTKED